MDFDIQKIASEEGSGLRWDEWIGKTSMHFFLSKQWQPGGILRTYDTMY